MIFAYMMVVNLLESILVLAAPVIMSMILPQKWFFEKFVTRSVLLVSLLLGYLMYFNGFLNYQTPFPLDLVYRTPLIVAGIFVIVFLVDWSSTLDKILIELSDRLVIFLYISMPVSAISLLVILVRNIF